jgi:hypothetical protein
MFVLRAKVQLTNVTISHNHAEGGPSIGKSCDGGGVSVSDNAYLFMTGCRVLHNTVTFNGAGSGRGSGAGVCIQATSTVQIQDVRYRDRTHSGPRQPTAPDRPI